MSEKLVNLIQDDEISLKDIIDFLIEFWRSIIISGLLGVLISIGYLIVTPNKYQAIAQIKMAQIQIAQVGEKNTNPMGVNLEEPNLLIARLRLPTIYSAEVIKACGFENELFPAEELVASAKFSAVKGVDSIIELKIIRDTKKNAMNCAQNLFESIRASQDKIIEPYIQELKVLLTKYKARLVALESLVYRDEKLGAVSSVVYLVNRDGIKFLTEEIFRLNTFIATTNSRYTKLVSPIFVSDAPEFPKKRVSLMVGLSAGLFLGLLFAMCKKVLKNHRASSIDS